MNQEDKKVLIINTGGTIGMKKEELKQRMITDLRGELTEPI